MKTVFICLVLTLALGLPTQASAPLDDAALRVQDRYDQLQGLQADYVQILTNAATGEEDRRTGRIYFQKPMQIRWEAETPERELLVMDGDRVWNYFPEENEVYEYRVEDILNSRTMLNFISGQARLAEDFRVEVQGSEQGLDKLRLVPREPEPNLVLAYLWTDPEGLLHRIMLVDFFGNSNELRFESIKTDPDLDPEKFTFEAPEGAEVLEGTDN